MGSPPTFIMSLDCEGKWGMADRLKPYHHDTLTTAKITGAYRQLLGMLARHDLSATFAFVMAFTLGEEERKGFPVLELRDPDDEWLAHYWRDLDAGRDDGWHVPETIELVRKTGGHEIASHGFCHRPLAGIPDTAVAAELAEAAKVAKLKGVVLESLVFPRNEVGNLQAVSAAGYLGYRERLNRKGGRVAALLGEFSTSTEPQQPIGGTTGLVAIPSGHFFNWRFGARRLVPPARTVARWRNHLQTCAREGGVVHLWLHPHNLITGPGTAEVLEQALAEVARLRDAGRIEVLTQRDYCRREAGLQRAA
ncbi:polysaccharide deacetylase family protein [Sphingomonas alba]|uniref:Chitooligosaccharide deacetylase n=1 Tax=Sphingomonas alba TaxID=2908208 RepID=A0ABT0RJ96_9SPHN|nr:polysaccharide deacetylase family protein [Sphingomonas alba]MCL6682698.1 polysaccharide deacetylase family protein [Sphingomonas alba]